MCVYIRHTHVCVYVLDNTLLSIDSQRYCMVFYNIVLRVYIFACLKEGYKQPKALGAKDRNQLHF